MGVNKNLKNGDIVGNAIYLEERPPFIYPNTENSKRKNQTRRKALFKCKCGNEFEAIIDLVKRRNTNSCGCWIREHMKKMHIAKSTHNKTNHRLYHIWRGLIERCENTNNISYCFYGARGIKVCERWKDINNFIDDMYDSYTSGLQIDRIDNNGNYEPNNCRWVTRKVNCNNTRKNRSIEFNGIKKNLGEWSTQLGISQTTLAYRLKYWNIEKALTWIHPSKYGKEDQKSTRW